MRCPLCNGPITHSALQETLKPLNEVKALVDNKIRERIEVEGIAQEERVIDPSSDYYNKPFEYAEKIFAFYQCFSCKLPYYGGRRACEAQAEEEVDAKEFVCPDCASMKGKGKCDVPGHDDYILWKCRFCCDQAVWFCWGRVHFCEYCHSHDPWGRDRGDFNGEERGQCPPPGKAECPSGGNHPPNNNSQDSEFAIGCGMCRNEVQGGNAKKAAELGL